MINAIRSWLLTWTLSAASVLMFVQFVTPTIFDFVFKIMVLALIAVSMNLAKATRQTE